MIIQQKIVTLGSVEDRPIDIKEIEYGLDFILNHFNQYRLFPRTIMTKKLGYQKEVFSKEEILSYFINSDFLDCRINAFPLFTDYKGIQRYPPDLIFIDLDKNNFSSNRSFENAFSTTLKNIKEKLADNNAYPTVLETGGGYHIYQPVYCPTALENVTEFNGFDRPSEQFLRFAKHNLSNGKADKNNNPSFKSCLLRIPGSINSKYDKQVTILQKWNGYRPNIPREFIEEFRTYLIQKKIDQDIQRQKLLLIRSNKNKVDNKYYTWIEHLLQNPIEDYRKLVIDLILSPYLINIRKLSYSESYQIIKDWLDKCNNLKKLDNYRNFEYRISCALKNADKKQIGPMSKYTLETNMNYKDLYLLLLQKQKEKREKVLS